VLAREEGQSSPASDGGGADDPAEAEAHLKSLIEAVLFVADRPIELKELARLVKLDRRRLTELLAALTEDYRDRGIYLQEVGGGYAFRTNPIHSVTVKKFLAQRPVRLSRAQLETLAIVAYRQPITRPEVDDIRGVDSGPVLKGLFDRELIRILGKKDEPGRPMLYGTSPQFLELFNLGSLQDLPTLKEFTELSDDSRLTYENETGEDVPEGSLIPEVDDPDGVDEQPTTDSAASMGVAGDEADESEDADAGDDEDDNED
jgi:segregation and condensation protein B